MRGVKRSGHAHACDKPNTEAKVCTMEKDPSDATKCGGRKKKSWIGFVISKINP